MCDECGHMAAPRGNFMFDPAKHSDFLGAILGTGGVWMHASMHVMSSHKHNSDGPQQVMHAKAHT